MLFENTEIDSYLTNQAVIKSGYENRTWTVKFSDGGDGWSYLTSSYYARCVSGVSKYEDIEFERDSDLETVRDLTNGLVWQDSPEFISKTWQSANTYCKNLDFANENDWRLPTVDELYSITDQRQTSVPTSNSIFKNVESSYWTASILKPAYSWRVQFISGGSSYTHQANIINVRCVRY